MATVAPPPLLPPGKVDVRQMRVVAEVPSRRRVELHFSKKSLPKLNSRHSELLSPPQPPACKDEAASPNFFLTSMEAESNPGDAALREAQV